MLSKNLIAAGLIAATALTAVPANATGFTFHFGNGGPGFSWGYGGPGHGYRDRGHRWGHHRLSPREVRWMLRERGYYKIRFMDRRGPVYQVRAKKRHRAFVLVISARSGEILSRHRIRRHGWH